MTAIRRFLAFWYRIIPWIAGYPATSFVQRIKIFFDYIHLYRTKGLSTEEYYEFEFEKRSREFRDSFLGVHEQRLYLDLLNPTKYCGLCRNKFLAHKTLEDVGVRKTELYCYYQPEGRIFDSELVATTLSDTCRILRSKGVEQCVIKDTENSHGEGVMVVKSIEYLDGDCKLSYFNGGSAMLSDVIGRHPLIFEALIVQSGQFARFNPSSVNTVRFMTALYPDGEAKIIATFIKIGREGRCVDNAGAGGNVDVCVDVESGEIKYAIEYNGWRKIASIEKHPDSGAQLNGVVIENWEELKAEVIRYQQAMPWCKAAGWDIAVTQEGAVVIEVNDFWDRTGQYFIRRGWRNEIRDCYLAWVADGKRYNEWRNRQALSRRHLRRIVGR